MIEDVDELWVLPARLDDRLDERLLLRLRLHELEQQCRPPVEALLERAHLSLLIGSGGGVDEQCWHDRKHAIGERAVLRKLERVDLRIGSGFGLGSRSGSGSGCAQT